MGAELDLGGTPARNHQAALEKSLAANPDGTVLSMRRRMTLEESLAANMDGNIMSVRRRMTLDESEFLGGSQRFSQYTQYGRTPNVIKRIRAARADIGDMGRELFMHDYDIIRLPYILDASIDEVYSRFDSFIRNFNVDDFDGVLTLSDEYELLEKRDLFDSTWGSSYYGLKMILYIESRFKSNLLDLDSKRKIWDNRDFEVNLSHVWVFDPVLYNLLVKYPADCICELDKMIQGFFESVLSSHLALKGVVVDHKRINWTPRVILFGKPEYDSISALGPSDIDTLVSLSGIVIRCSEVIPEMTMATFRCTGNKKTGLNSSEKCTAEVYEYVIQGEVNEPRFCGECKSRNSFELWHNMCCFASKQLIKLVELPKLSSEAPQSIMLYSYDDLIDKAVPGDKVEVTGIFKASAIRINPRTRSCGAIYRTFVNAISIRRKVAKSNRIVNIPRSNHFNTDGENPLNYSSEIISGLLSLSKNPEIYDMLVASFAPSIQGRDDVKRGLLCQLFGASQDPESGMRAQINVLLCGDPSTAKSQLLRYVHMLAPRGVYTSGKGSSQVGLTAYVRKDPETREYVLESGAVVLSDGGVCCIDEFDKMEENARAILHEVMEQQTVTVAKAGIVTTLNARTAILASANPVNSRYDKRKAVVENVNLPPSLFSRFDLIYLVLDCIDPVEDRNISKRLCQSFAGSEWEWDEPPIDPVTLARYISFSRANCNPYLTLESRNVIVDEYLKMRRVEGISPRAPCASTRQLEGLIRLSQALAKMRLSPRVTASDAREAVRLMRSTTFQSLVDPNTGRIDFDQLATGLSAAAAKRLQTLKNEIISALELITSTENFASYDDIFDRCRSEFRNKGEFLERRQFDEALSQLQYDQKIYKSIRGFHLVS